MALIHRRGCTFFIRSVRRDGRVTSEYVGSGPLAEYAFATSLDLRERREADREARRAANADLMSRIDAAQAPMRAYCALADALVRAAMEGAGYHRPKRGVWRKHRMSTLAINRGRPTGSVVGRM